MTDDQILDVIRTAQSEHYIAGDGEWSLRINNAEQFLAALRDAGYDVVPRDPKPTNHQHTHKGNT